MLIRRLRHKETQTTVDSENLHFWTEVHIGPNMDSIEPTLGLITKSWLMVNKYPWRGLLS